MRHRQDPRFEHHAVILAPRPGALGEALTSAGIPYAHVLRGRMRHPAALLRARSGLRRAVRAIAPDWVLANSPQGFLYARLAVPFGPPRVALYYMTVPRSRLLANPALDVLMAVARPAMTLTASRRIADTLARAAAALARLEKHPGSARAARDAIRELGRIAGYIEDIVNALEQHLDGRKLNGVKRRLDQLASREPLLSAAGAYARRIERLVEAEGYFRALADGLRT